MNLKKAFSLVEVLLVMGIIAVVMAMGFSISRRGMENAHNQYWYTGYDALRRATIDAANSDRITIGTQDGALNSYAEHLANLMNAKLENNCNNFIISLSQCRLISAPNGIQYAVWYQPIEGEPTSFYGIDMAIPAIRQINNDSNNVSRFIYPLVNSDFPHNEVVVYPGVTSDGYLNLQDRVDLLPFYLTDGEPNSGPSRTFYSFREAFCQANGGTSFGDSENHDSLKINCDGITTNDDLRDMLIKPINPKKAF